MGIPTVIDRIIQQAIAQVLIPIYEPKFSDGSYGYRPHRSAKDAILKVEEWADEGYKYAVCLDLSKYFDTLKPQRILASVKSVPQITVRPRKALAEVIMRCVKRSPTCE